jgi:hypothetical protein
MKRFRSSGVSACVIVSRPLLFDREHVEERDGIVPVDRRSPRSHRPRSGTHVSTEPAVRDSKM